MNSVTVSVEKFAAAGKFWTHFKGSEGGITVTFPDGRQENMIGLLHIANARNLEESLENYFVVGTFLGPITVPTGTKITIADKSGIKYAVRKVR